jgi:putative endonuclease
MLQLTYVYIVDTVKGGLYTGITNNLERRFDQHKGLLGGGAKYVKSNGFKKLLYLEVLTTRGEAMKRENAIKRMSRDEKLEVIESDKNTLKTGLVTFTR